MSNYEAGQFHPSLHNDQQWYRCHPAFGVMPFRNAYELDDLLENLGDEHPWNNMDEEVQDELTDRYCLALLDWFTNERDVQIHFAGAYEKHELELVRSLGMDEEFHGVWDRKYSPMLTNVNVHEMTFESNGKMLEIFETWDNIIVNFDPQEIPAKFTCNWC
jgi:hypothetical protein